MSSESRGVVVPVLLRARSLLAAAVVVLVLVVGSAGIAQAHNSLRSTQPVDGATVPEPPSQVVLTFDGNVLDVGTAVEVTGPAGPVTLRPLQVAGPVVTQPLPADLPAGEYRVVWRVTSSDGHPVDGVLTFAAAQSSAGAAGATGAPGSPSGPAAAQTGAATAIPTPSAGQSQATTKGSNERPDGAAGGFPPLVWGLGALAVVVVVGASWYGATRRHGGS